MRQNEKVETPAGHPEILEGYLRRDELAAQLGRCRRTIERWHSLRIGPPRITIGRLVLYRVESVREWLAEQQEAGNRREPAPVRASDGGRRRIAAAPARGRRGR